MSVLHSLDFLIQWHLTERCNLSCGHCYQTGGRSAELTLGEIRDGMSEIDEMFSAWSDSYGMPLSPSFNISGGEPLLRQDLAEVLSELQGRRYATYLLTNGTLIDRARARQLAGLGVRGVQVSIEGCEDVHDALRGPGSFSRAVDGVEHLLDAGLPVTLNITLSRLNSRSVRRVIQFASHLGVQRVGFSRLVAAGRGSAMVSEMLSADEVRSLYGELFSREIRGLEIVSGDPVAGQMRNHNGKAKWKEAPGIPAGGCSAGVAGLTFLADGTIVPCRRLPVPIGNLRTDPLREIWAMSPVLEALRDKSRYGVRCGDCERWEDCRGCRGVAYAYSRAQGGDDFLADDPQCFLTE